MEAVFLKIVNMSLTAGWMVLAVMALRALFPGWPKRIRVILWALVGIRLVLPFSFQTSLSLIPSSEPLPQEFLYAAAPKIATGIPVLNDAINPVLAGSLTPHPGASANPTQIWSFIFSQIWILGMVVMVLYAAFSFLAVRRRVSVSIPLGSGVMLCDRIDTPFILGIFRPRIYLPSDLDPKTADMVLAHEKAHLKRRDHWWKPLGFALLCLHWFNPLVLTAYILLCRDIELACDEQVIRQMGPDVKKEYASALLRCSVSRKRITACPLAFGETGVKGRIRSVLRYKEPAFWLILAAAVICLLVAACFLTDPIARIDPLTLEDWGITITAMDVTNLGVTLAIQIPDNLDGRITIPSNQILLQLSDGEWVEPLPITEDEPLWDSVKFLYPDYRATYQRVEWRTVYGSVPPGDYRICKTLWLYQDGLGYQKDFYVDFTVPDMSQPENITYEEARQLYLCRNVLEQIQALDSYRIHAQREFAGADILNDTSSCDYWKSGSDLLRVGHIPADGSTHGYWQRGGACYESTTWDGTIVWEACGALEPEVMAPWLITHVWNDLTTRIAGWHQDQEGITISVEIGEPYALKPESAESYRVDFRFDPENTFRYAVLTAENASSACIITFTVESTDSEEIRDQMAQFPTP